MTHPAIREDEIDDILECIGRAWKQVPEQRLGQLIDNARHGEIIPQFFAPDWTLVENIERFSENAMAKIGANEVTGATGPWIPVTEREPAARTVVLARWKDGAVRVVEWSPKSHEGQQEGPLPGQKSSIWMAHLPEMALGMREWPTEWAEIY